MSKLVNWADLRVATLSLISLPTLYVTKGAKGIWVQGGASSLERHQCTVQLNTTSKAIGY